MPHLSAIRSAASNWVVNSYWLKYDLGRALPGPLSVSVPSGTLLIDSTPAARTVSAAPVAMRPAAKLRAWSDEPQWASTVVPATEYGSPALSHAVRATSKDCSPTFVTHPATSWSTRDGSRPVRSSTLR